MVVEAAMAKAGNPNHEPKGSPKGGQFASGNAAVNKMIRKGAGKSSKFNILAGFTEAEKTRIKEATDIIQDVKIEVSISSLEGYSKYGMVSHAPGGAGILVNPKTTLTKSREFIAAVIRHEIFHLEKSVASENEVRDMVSEWISRMKLSLSKEDLNILNSRVE
jgi:ABC-type branched-subunit amino acid transport system ATPase component